MKGQILLGIISLFVFYLLEETSGQEWKTTAGVHRIIGLNFRQRGDVRMGFRVNWELLSSAKDADDACADILPGGRLAIPVNKDENELFTKMVRWHCENRISSYSEFGWIGGTRNGSYLLDIVHSERLSFIPLTNQSGDPGMCLMLNCLTANWVLNSCYAAGGRLSICGTEAVILASGPHKAPHVCQGYSPKIVHHGCELEQGHEEDRQRDTSILALSYHGQLLIHFPYECWLLVTANVWRTQENGLVQAAAIDQYENIAGGSIRARECPVWGQWQPCGGDSSLYGTRVRYDECQSSNPESQKCDWPMWVASNPRDEGWFASEPRNTCYATQERIAESDILCAAHCQITVGCTGYKFYGHTKGCHLAVPGQGPETPHEECRILQMSP